MKKSSIVAAAILFALLYAMLLPAETVPVEFYDEAGNLLVGYDVLVLTDQGGQKLSPAPGGLYEFSAEPGQKVRFRVSGNSCEFRSRETILPEEIEGPLQLVLAVEGENETCESALPIGIGDTVAGDTAGNNAANFPDGGFCGTSITAPGIGDWYEVLVPAGGTSRLLEASTCNQASFDTKLSVFCFECSNQQCLVGNDDGPGCGGFTSLVQWCAPAGEPQQIFVHGFNGATGAYNLTVRDLGPCTSPFFCNPGPPPPPEGACCFDNCDVVAGAPEPVFTECLTVDCRILDAGDCSAAGGAFAGEDTPCSSPSTAAIVFGDSPNAAIPDNDPAGLRTEIVIPDGDATINDLNVGVTTHHTWIGDLAIYVEHKTTGTEVQLWDRNCGSSNALDVLFDDEGTQSLCGASGNPTTGSIPPGLTNGFTSALSDFDGESLGGAWSLSVDDDFTGDTGTLDFWSLIFREAVPTCAAGCDPDGGPGPGPGPGDDEDAESPDEMDDGGLAGLGRSNPQVGSDGLLDLDAGFAEPGPSTRDREVRDAPPRRIRPRR